MADPVSEQIPGVVPAALPTEQPSPQDASPQEQPAEQTQEQPNFVTREELAQHEADLMRRMKQSTSDMVQARVNERFAALEVNRKTLGLSDEQFEAAKQKIVVEEFSAKPEAAPASAAQPDAQAQVHPVLAATMEAFQKAGVEIVDGDPEMPIILKAWNDPNGNMIDYGAAVQNAIEAKKARLASQKDKAAVRAGGAGNGSIAAGKPLTAEEKISKGLGAASWPSQEPPQRQPGT